MNFLNSLLRSPMKSALFTLLTLFAFTTTSFAGVASPSLARIISTDNFATEGFKDEGLDISIGTGSLSNTTNEYTLDPFEVTQRWDSIFIGLNLLETGASQFPVSQTTNTAINLGYALNDDLSFGLSSSTLDNGTNSTASTEIGVAWRMEDFYLGLVSYSDDNSTTGMSFSVAYVMEDSFRIEVGTHSLEASNITTDSMLTEIEGRFMDITLGYAGASNSNSSTGDVYLSWEMEDDGFSVAFHSYMDDSPAFNDSSLIELGWTF